MIEDVSVFLRDYIRNEINMKGPLEEKTNLKDAGLDSLDIVNLLFAIEEKLGVKIPDEDVDEKELLVFGNLVGFISERFKPTLTPSAVS